MFDALSGLIPQANPTSVLVDFEAAPMNVIRQNFPNAQLKGCYYHLTQNIYRRVQLEGLQVQYGTDNDFSTAVRMIAALAFVPSDDVVRAFEALQDAAPAEARPILDYFEDNYIGRLLRHDRRREPPNAIPLWNMHGRAIDDLPKTNNSVEGWHRKMASAVTCHHPNI